jgi:hypothetical protein
MIAALCVETSKFTNASARLSYPGIKPPTSRRFRKIDCKHTIRLSLAITFQQAPSKFRRHRTTSGLRKFLHRYR